MTAGPAKVSGAGAVAPVHSVPSVGKHKVLEFVFTPATPASPFDTYVLVLYTG